MEIIDLHGQKEFSATHHIHKTLVSTPHSEISVVGWEPGQKSPIHCHPSADEIYHVLEGEGLYRVQAGPDRKGKSLEAWPAR